MGSKKELETINTTNYILLQVNKGFLKSNSIKGGLKKKNTVVMVDVLRSSIWAIWTTFSSYAKKQAVMEDTLCGHYIFLPKKFS